MHAWTHRVSFVLSSLAIAACAVAPADDTNAQSSSSAISYKPTPIPPFLRDRGISINYTNGATGTATNTVALRYDGVNTVYCADGCLVANYTIWDNVNQVEAVTGCDYMFFVAAGPYEHGYVIAQESGPLLCTGVAYSGSATIPADWMVDAFEQAVGETSLPAFCQATNNKGTTVTFTSYVYAEASGSYPTTTGSSLLIDVIEGSRAGTAPLHPDMPAASQTLTVSLACD